MFRRNPGGAARLAALCALVVGCSSAEQKPQRVDTSIPITPEPAGLALPAGQQWPAFFKGASCLVEPQAGPKIKPAEMEAFAKAFQEEFFGSNTPFRNIDPDAAKRARERQVLMADGTEAGTQAMLQNAPQNYDFKVTPRFDFRVEPRQGNANRLVDSEILGMGSVNLQGSPSKNNLKLDGTLDHNQLSNFDKSGEMRVAHAAALGKYLAKKMLVTLASASGESTLNSISVQFKFFDENQKTEIRDYIVPEIPGVSAVDEDSMDQAQGVFTLVVQTKSTPTEFQRELQFAFEERGQMVRTARSGELLQVVRQ